MFVLSVIGILLSLFVESETIVKVILPIFLVLLFVFSVGGVLFALHFKKNKNN
jgi:cbb3-type cytochrome oxidase subunit 3